MKLLITNDDGIHARGIYHLKKALEKDHEITVVAPETERSAVGHAITLSDPLRVFEVYKEDAFFGYAVNGTPADCVKLGIKSLLPERPDLVVSGINLGPNTAINIIYSGTVSAAAEAVIMGVPGVAVSLASFNVHEYEYAGRFTRELLKKIEQFGLREGTLLNINVPAVKPSEIKGVVVSRQGKGRFEEFFDKRVDPTNRVYYWLAGKKMHLDTDPDVDDVVVTENKVSITPIRYDLTDHEMLARLKEWGIER